MRFLLGFDGWVRSRIKTDRRQTRESSGGEQLTPRADPLPRLFVKEEGDRIDARLDDRDPARERDRSGHRIRDAEPDRHMERERGEDLDRAGGHGPSPAAATPAQPSTVPTQPHRPPP